MSRHDFRENFDRKVADAFLAANNNAKKDAAGLPAFLGVSFTDFSPGRLRAELEVRTELLTPFENMHGGISPEAFENASRHAL